MVFVIGFLLLNNCFFIGVDKIKLFLLKKLNIFVNICVVVNKINNVVINIVKWLIFDENILSFFVM